MKRNNKLLHIGESAVFEINEDLKNEGVESIKYYYKNCPILGNIFTVCLFFSKDKKILSRGVSICSVKDSHNKKFARENSRRRAIFAIFSKTNCLPINCYNTKETNRRTMSTHTKLFKVKTKDDEEKLIEQIKSSAVGSYSIKMINGIKFIEVVIPYTTPMEITSKYFTYKSEFNPVPTQDERSMFRL